MNRFILLATAFALVACKDNNPTGPAPQVPAAVAITTPQTIMTVGASVPLTATGL